jgi:uncharacterized protein YacL
MLNLFKKNIKVLDTSSIIDGRILSILELGFIDSKILVPDFVVNELQVISDSQDELKRKKGRRGLELLDKMKKNDFVEIYYNSNKDINNINEVDLKLIKLCKQKKYKLITTDFNLDKNARIQDIKVLNVNELSTVLKTFIDRGDSITTIIVKKGNQKGQGIGYMDDGTMIVVDGAEDNINERVKVFVKSILQNSGTRIIFAKLYSE